MSRSQIIAVGYLALAILLGPCVVSQPAYAQLSSASVTGVVRDSSGAIVPDVEVVLKNLDTTVARSSTSNASGNYVLVNIPPGRYSLAANKAGFRPFFIPEMTLAVDQTATRDINFTVGDVTQTIKVEATGELIESSTAELGAVVATKQVNDLPLNGRNFTQLLSLTPGSAPINGPQQVVTSFANTVAQGTQFNFPSVNGAQNRGNIFMLDGLNNEDPLVSTYVVPPIIDAIQEFKINAHNDQAEFGAATGGIVNVVTKSGTNSYNGAVWEYLRNSDFNARNTFNPSVTPFHQNQFGTIFSGPVWIPKIYNGKNKTFFFFGYESFRYSQSNNAYIQVPTAQELTGNFSDQSRQIYNPYTTRPDPNNPTAYIRDPFPGNMIPTSMLDPSMLKYAQTLLPHNTFATGVGTDNAVDATPLIQAQDEYTAKIDQSIGTRNFIWFRFSSIILDERAPVGLPGLAAQIHNPGQNYGFSYVRTFSPSTVMEIEYGRTRQQHNTQDRWNSLPSGFLQSLNFAPNQVSSFLDGTSLVPNMTVTGDFSGGELTRLMPNEANIHQIKGSLTKVVGSHTFKMGAELATTGFEEYYEYANPSFDTPQTANPSNSSGGLGLASFLMGLPTGGIIRNVYENERFGGVVSGYFEDSWKAAPKLTVNLGLRYDLTLIPAYGTDATIGKQGGIETGDLDLNNGTYILQVVPPSCASRGHASCIPTADGSLPAHVVASPNGKISHNTYTNLGPRAGLAYRLTENTAIRSSFGIFYDNWAGFTQMSQNLGGNWPDVSLQRASNLNTPTSAGGPLPTTTVENIFPGGNLPAANPFSQVSFFFDPYMKNPYSMQYNVGIEHQFTNSTALTVNYVGSGSRRLDIGGYYNTALTPGPGTPQSRAPYPYIAPTDYDRSIGKANYNALQVMWNRRFSGGLAYQVSYTWSKSIDDGASDLFANGTLITDPYHYQNSRSVSYYDLTHVLSVNIVYELPIGTGKALRTSNKALDYVIGNWQVNTITTARSGQPYSITVSGDVANTGNGGTYETANMIGDPNLSNPTRQKWFNTSAFQIPAVYTFGSLGRDIFRSEPFWNIDASIFRQFPIFEKRMLEFRAEAFNIVNTVIYDIPSTSMTASNFGQVVSTANSARTLQFGLKLRF